MSETDKARGVNLGLLDAFRDMLEVPRWLVWSWVKRGARWTKVPHIPGTIIHARVNDPRGVIYAEARAAVTTDSQPAAGVGWRLLGDVGRVWIDLDKCRDPITGATAPWAEVLLAWAPEAYREVTPSGRGWRIMGRLFDVDPTTGEAWAAFQDQVPMHDLLLGADPAELEGLGGSREAEADAAFEVFHASARYVTVSGWDGRGRGDVDLSGLVGGLRRLARDHGGRPGRAGQRTGFDADGARVPLETLRGPIEDVTACLELLPNKDAHYNTWVAVGLAAHGASGGSEEGFAAFEAWSEKSGKHDPVECRKKWDELAPMFAGIESLAARVRLEVDRDWKPPSRRAEAEFDVVDLPPGSPSGPVTPDGGERPIIKVRAGELHRLASEAEAALIASGIPVFQRSMLVRPAITELDAADGGRTHVMALHRLDAAGMLDLFCRTGKWMKFSRQLKKDIPADPPETVAKILLGRVGEWKLPHLRGIVAHPTLRRDGSLLATPGYDPTSGYYLAMPSNLAMAPIDAAPTRDECLQAALLLEDLLVEFPFIDTASRSVALSLLMTAVLRSAMDVAPIHAATAPRRGSGKSFLYDIAAALVYGSRCPVIYAGASAEELEKKLNGLLLRGVTLFSIDNLNIPLEGDLICQIATQTLLDLRRLGRSDMIQTPNSALAGVTGNNLVVKEDVTRRVVMASMDAGLERPELRLFEANPFRMIMRDRGKYLRAVLTIARGYQVTNEKMKLTPLGSFDDYTRLVREPLVWLDRADPAATMEQLHDADPVMAGLRGVMAAWEAVIGLNRPMSAAAVIELTQSQAVEDIPKKETDDERKAREARDVATRVARHALSVALSSVSKRGTGITALELGQWLRRHADGIADGRRFKGETDVHSKVVVWRLT